jgi:O-antigen/teichoic acid export membrane protein
LVREIMNARFVIKNMSIAFLAQGVSLVMGVIQSLLIPKLLGVTQYGYWQLFIFYSGYVGFFHLGLNDGVYLINGGKARDEIDKSLIYSQFIVSVVFETLVAIAVSCFAAASGFGAARVFVLICTAIFMVVQNAASYVMYVLQAMNETKLSSYSTMVERGVFLVPLVLLLALRVKTFEPYVIAFIFSSTVQLIYCCYQVREFPKSGFEGWPIALRESIASVRVGSKLMIANIASGLIVGVCRFAIDAKWGIKTFGELSFALSLLSLYTAFVSQASMVLFPSLKQSKYSEIKKFYVHARDTLSLMFPAVYALYFPMMWLLLLWLPQYAKSMSFFVFVLPICVFDSKMDITCTTMFKVMREESRLLYINLVTVAFSACGVLFGTYVLQSVYVAISAAVIAIIGRSIYSEHFISKRFEVGESSIAISEVVLTIVFICMTEVLPGVIAFLGYCAAYACYLFAYKKRVREIAGMLRKI